MEKVEIKKSIKTKTGIKFEFRFDGTPTKKIEVPEEKINNFLNNCTHNNMENNVTAIRTILKDYKESLLIISYKSNEVSEYVGYDKGNLFVYEKTMGKNTRYRVKYESQKIKYEIYNQEDKIFKANNEAETIKAVSDVISDLYKLQEVKSIELNQVQKIIIEVYKLFYEEYPNFMDENIIIKIQTMMGILAAYGIDLGEEFSFNLEEYEGQTIPMSSKLTWLIKKLYPLGQILEVEEPIDLPEKTIKKIKVVGEVINSYALENNDLNFLVYMSQYVYVNRYEMPMDILDNNLIMISKDLGCEVSQIQKALLIAKEIDSKLNNKKS